ncbi:hypothetical protein NIES2104_26610 [Leptolyngbya sp. NIES-2104]|nr:hypothetical protein NIES2104_26610 [Leptolyngbya sp. NIES-2104]
MWLGFAFGELFRECWLTGRLCIQFKQFLEAFGVVFAAAIDAIEDFVSEIVCFSDEWELAVHAIGYLGDRGFS